MDNGYESIDAKWQTHRKLVRRVRVSVCAIRVGVCVRVFLFQIHICIDVENAMLVSV